MRKVQTSTLKPEHLNMMAEHSSNAWLNTQNALSSMARAKTAVPRSPRRREFLDTVKNHVDAANASDKKSEATRVGISSMNVPQRVEQFNIGMS